MMVAAERAAWHNPRILSTLLLVFLAGATTGALSMRLGLHQKLHRSAGFASRGPNRDAVLQKFKADLDLSGPHLSGPDLSGPDLSGPDLSGLHPYGNSSSDLEPQELTR